MDLNPYQSPSERGMAQESDYRRLCGWCAWAMFSGAVLANLALMMSYLTG